MEVLKFIFVLGINFSIFGFIWGILMFFIKSLGDPRQTQRESFTYVFRIIKYFLLVSVTANFISIYEVGDPGQPVDVMHIVIGSIVLGLYLLGKFQNRAVMNQFASNPMFARLVPKIDPKVERFLLLGAIAYFIACLVYPQMVDNGVINWFTSAIMSIYETPIIGWIFQLIAFFFLISILMRGANVIGRLLNGQSLTDIPNVDSSFTFRTGGTHFEDDNATEEDEEGFTDYEDVTDEDEGDQKIE